MCLFFGAQQIQVMILSVPFTLHLVIWLLQDTRQRQGTRTEDMPKDPY